MKTDAINFSHLYRNFSDEDLKELINLNNHKAICTGKDNFEWKRKEKGEWIVVPNISKTSARKIYHMIRFNISKWSEELELRQNKAKKVAFFESSRRSKFMFDVFASNMKTKEKVREILDVYPDTSAEEISEVLHIGIKTIYKHINNLKELVATQDKVSSRNTEEVFEDDYEMGVDEWASWTSGDDFY